MTLMSEPPISMQAFHQSSGLNLPVTRIVIHATCPPGVPFPAASASGQAAATARYFTTPGSGGSAHYVEDLTSEEHCVAETAIAWHAPPNRASIGIEICGQSTYTRAQWLSPDVWPAVARAAARARDIADRRNVPLHLVAAADLRAGRSGICGHGDVSEAFHQSDHTDPGPNFPWDAFMQAVHGGTPPPVHVPAPDQEEDRMSLLIVIADNAQWLWDVANGKIMHIADPGDSPRLEEAGVKVVTISSGTFAALKHAYGDPIG